MFAFLNTAFSALMQLGSRVASLVYAGLVLVFTPVVRLIMRAVRHGNRAAASTKVEDRKGFFFQRFQMGKSPLTQLLRLLPRNLFPILSRKSRLFLNR